MEINDIIYVRVNVYGPPPYNQSYLVTLPARHFYSSEQFERFELWLPDWQSIILEKDKLITDQRVLKWKRLDNEDLPASDQMRQAVNSATNCLDVYLADKRNNGRLYRSGHYFFVKYSDS